MADGGIDGIALGLIAAGGGLAYAGIRGKSIPALIQAAIAGKSPATAATTSPIQQVVQTSAAPGSSVSNTTPVVEPTSASQTAWAVALLASIGALPTTANVNSVIGWMDQESPWNDQPPDGGQYTHNPLNTTEPGFGESGTVNPVGVAIYPTEAQGLAATVAALENGDYADILAALRSGKGLTGTYAGLSTWSGGGYDSIGGG